MQQNIQEIYPYQTDQIDLRKVAQSLKERRWFIFGLTGFVTLLAIIYTLNVATTYRSFSSFTLPSQSSILSLNSFPLISETTETVFASFLKKLSTKKLQEKVFYENDYLTALNLENEPIDDVEAYVASFLSSVAVETPVQSADLLERPYSISMEGHNGEVISSFLNELVVAANSETVSDYINLIKQKSRIRLDQIATERKLLLAQAKQSRLYEIETLTYAVKLAGSLGIVENNLKQYFNLNRPFAETEKALLERIELLESRASDEPFIPVALDNETTKLEKHYASDLDGEVEGATDGSFIGAGILTDKDGNVGIGTASPRANFEVASKNVTGMILSNKDYKYNPNSNNSILSSVNNSGVGGAGFVSQNTMNAWTAGVNGNDYVIVDSNDVGDSQKIKLVLTRDGSLILSGHIRIADTSVSASIAGAGALRYSNDRLEISDGFDWNPIYGTINYPWVNFPEWYLYGEKALLERIELLENRASDEPFIPVVLDNEKLKLESSIVKASRIDMTVINAIQLIQAAVSPSTPIQSKRLIVLLAFICSFMISIFLVLVMDALKPDEKNFT